MPRYLILLKHDSPKTEAVINSFCGNVSHSLLFGGHDCMFIATSNEDTLEFDVDDELSKQQKDNIKRSELVEALHQRYDIESEHREQTLIAAPATESNAGQPLLSLPAEMRNMIYRATLVSDSAIRVSANEVPPAEPALLAAVAKFARKLSTSTIKRTLLCWRWKSSISAGS